MASRAELDELIQDGLKRRVAGEYDEALELFERAISLDRTAPEPYRYAGQTKSYKAAELLDANEKAALLEEAERLVLEAEKRQRGESPDTLHDRAWIADERGRFEDAIGLYERARELVRTEGRENKPIFTYNLACALTKAGHAERAIDELGRIVFEMRELIEKDPDFEELRASPKLQAMLEGAKQAAG